MVSATGPQVLSHQYYMMLNTAFTLPVLRLRYVVSPVRGLADAVVHGVRAHSTPTTPK